MSRHHYECGKEIVALKEERGWPFYALIQAAMRLADTENQAKLAAMWPEVWVDLLKRYDAPGGILQSDPPYTGPGAALWELREATAAGREGPGAQ